MTDVQNLFSGVVVGKTAYLTLQLNSLNETTAFPSADTVSLGKTDQKIQVSLADVADYVIDSLSYDNSVLDGGVAADQKSAWLALKADPTAKSSSKWSMTLTEAVPGQKSKTITIDPVVEPDPDASTAPVIDKLNGVLPGS